MATFSYTILEPSGKKVQGFFDAASEEAARASLSTDGRYLLEIKSQTSKQTFGSEHTQEKKAKGNPSKSDLALFTRRLADLAEAGLPLDRVLQVVSEQTENEILTNISIEVLDEVKAGSPVSAALAKHPKFFPEVFTSTLRSGEATGQFGEVAQRLADFQEKEVVRRGKVVSALTYPAILTFVAIAVIIGLLTFVVPALSGTFKELGTNLPISTVILLAVTDFLTKQWYIAVGILVALIVGYRIWIATENGLVTRDALLLKLPIIGKIALRSTVSRFARVLGTLIYGGVPILDALDLAGLAAGNRLFRQSARTVEADVREGRPIAEAMRDTGVFPPVLTHMVAVGEETGDLPKMLARVADSLDFEVDTALTRVTSLVEPIILVVMGVFVGFIVLSIALPIFEAQNLVK